MKKIFILLIVLFSVLQAKEHKVIKFINGFSIESENPKDYSVLEVNEEKKYGKLFSYDLAKHNEDGDRDESFSYIEIIENYKKSAEKLGADIWLYEPEGYYLGFTIKNSENNNIFVYVNSWDGGYTLKILEEKSMTQSLIFGNIENYKVTSMERKKELSEELKKESHPIIQLLPDFMIDKNEKKDFEKTVLVIDENESFKEISISGKSYHYDMTKRDENLDIDESFSKEEIIGNYKAAVLSKNGEIVHESENYINFKIRSSSGAILWGKVNAGDGWYTLHIIEEKGFTQTLVFGAEEMEKELEEKGKITLYGILFDTGKNTLKEQSFPQLEQVTKLLRKNKELKLEVQGHTDNIGNDKSNIELSEARSKQVIEFLGLFGVNTGNLESKGYGETKPVADNSTEEGRAKNRRVELVKID